ncbi:RNA polymerase-associated protein RapA [Lacimicrobium alkaliphilum]|uniref:RNA polymerase-associated protein RapA n=1 Tax=Lacimicrobium alkaliphilum TaxID=1526571 RepID=A0ABQ1QWJ0_9ALTE|nr:RNA polymerase-associated protein RapA [Lacimicrobium alkaliphilum]GGD48605.1 RNA polymerase-associated protein RapA [Lacimicrobium alkaliphilum]
MSFALGQRWISQTESELGLGTVVEIADRTVTLLFPATGEQRTYTLASAPLIRVTFGIGDKIASHQGWQLLVEEISELDGQLTYIGQRLDTGLNTSLKETFVDHHFVLDQPDQRLLSGQYDDPKWFDLRLACLEQQYQHQTSPLLGMTGARVDLIPHQIHIAAEVANRHAPRVLLADEVGLGKTIEAALIIHQQILTGRAARVLIVVPNSLVHQWLVEMLRRVNLAFAIFDTQRCQALSEESDNPFESEQLVLCSLDFLTQNPKYQAQAKAAPWDLLVVDEAHHLEWSEQAPSAAYQCIEALASVTRGVLLLTATPDQLGHASHFARLRLLDSDRFYDYQAFLQEEQGYSQLAEAIAPLLEGNSLTPEQISDITEFAPELADRLKNLNQATEQEKQHLLGELIDRHGTGRLLFRNSRSGIKGFPVRHLHSYPLDLPEQYQTLFQSEDLDVEYYLTPERHASLQEQWTQSDPRVDWFIGLLQQFKNEKVLVICASAGTAMQLAEALRIRAGIHAGIFHEALSIVERDKMAAFFAQSEQGAQTLICSEIGSEGRNFQFAHHLVLFDLPLLPDLLEQRIGRLDRIGQQQDIQIHLPYFAHSAQQKLLEWYHQGLNAFEHTCPVGSTVYEEVRHELLNALRPDSEPGLFDKLLKQTRQRYLKLREDLEAGRDKLLELNSSGRGKVEPLLDAIHSIDDSARLERFMGRLLDTIGVLQEDKNESSYILRPGDTMVNQLPGLDEEGLTITYERETALAIEDIQFFSADHPMVRHAMDLILTDTLGKSSLALMQDKSVANGCYFIECLFVLSANASRDLQLHRYLPPTPIRLCLDAKGKEVMQPFNELQPLNNKIAGQLLKALESQIQTGLKQAGKAAAKAARELRHSCLSKMQAELGDELDRLLNLKKLNPSIRDEEIQHLAHQIHQLGELINGARLQLEAIRLVVNSH